MAITRAIKNLYILEASEKHEILGLLGLAKIKDRVSMKEEVSSMPGVFRLSVDQLKKEARECLELGVRSVILTGDRRGAAEAVGREIWIGEVRAGLKPEDKVAAIREFEKEGHKVAMVGDGVNDAPSLAAAYVSVAMGTRGSDAALEQSEVVLMNDRIDNFLTARWLSERARSIIRQNLAISLGTVVLMAGAAILGLIPLSVGVFAHEGSTVLVCLNSLRILFAKGPGTPVAKE